MPYSGNAGKLGSYKIEAVTPPFDVTTVSEGSTSELFWGAIEKDAIQRSFSAWSGSRRAE